MTEAVHQHFRSLCIVRPSGGLSMSGDPDGGTVWATSMYFASIAKYPNGEFVMRRGIPSYDVPSFLRALRAAGVDQFYYAADTTGNLMTLMEHGCRVNRVHMLAVKDEDPVRSIALQIIS